MQAIKILSVVALISLVLLSVALIIFEEKGSERLISTIIFLTGINVALIFGLAVSVVCIFRYLG
ncbi:hypothetical protein [uncultured Anaerococcus sp.]|uniref:hypothetical protein n=1 Tax=uncultured Anaerococcus sp. TaxID=293428 RepID=UPI00262910CD|nr:hypothetical protein [uncultured Anaerococcus sp.]